MMNKKFFSFFMVFIFVSTLGFVVAEDLNTTSNETIQNETIANLTNSSILNNCSCEDGLTFFEKNKVEIIIGGLIILVLISGTREPNFRRKRRR